MGCTSLSADSRVDVVLDSKFEGANQNCVVQGTTTPDSIVSSSQTTADTNGGTTLDATGSSTPTTPPVNNQAPKPETGYIPVSYYERSGVDLTCSDSQSYYQFTIPSQAIPQSIGTQTLTLTNNQGWDLWIKISKIDTANGLTITNYQNKYQSFLSGGKTSFNVSWFWNVPNNYTGSLGAATVYFQTVCTKPADTEIYQPLPTVPDTFTVSNKTDNSLTLNWSNGDNATSYKVYLNNNQLIYSGSATTFTHTNLLSGTGYSYYLYAINSIGRSADYRYAYGATTGTNPIPSSPSNFVKTDATDNSISLSWSPVSSATSFKVTIDYSSGSVVCSGNITSCIVNNLTPGTYYRFYVTASNSYGTSSSSYLYTNTTGTSPLPGDTINYRVTNVTDTTISLAWDNMPNVTGYHLWNYVNVNLPNTQTTYTATGFTPGTYYYICLQGTNQYGQGPGNCIGATTTGTNPNPSTPTNFKATNITSNSMDLSWSPVSNATSYKIYRNGTIIYNGNGSSFSDTGLTRGTSYSYNLYAYNSYGSSSNAYLSATTTNPIYNGTSDIGNQCQISTFQKTFTIPNNATPGTAGSFDFSVKNTSNMPIFAKIDSVTKSGSLFQGTTPVELDYSTDPVAVARYAEVLLPIKWVYSSFSDSINDPNAPSTITVNVSTSCN